MRNLKAEDSKATEIGGVQTKTSESQPEIRPWLFVRCGESRTTDNWQLTTR
jgi:hypothetical protein